MMNHLTKHTLKLVEESSNEQRIEHCKKFKWIGYTEANKILKAMEDNLNYPRKHRMPNILLVGDSNNGKTALLQKFYRKFEAYIDEETEKVVNPIVMVQAPPEPDEKRFYNSILETLFAPFRSTERVDLKYMRVKRLLQELSTKTLIIDEIHHVLAGSPAKQRKFLNVLKHLANDLKISLICSGTKLAFNAIQTDLQLSNRFEPRVLPRWSFDTEFKRLLISFESILPLRKESNLVNDEIAHKLLSMSDGLIGEVSKVLELASILAIEMGDEKITTDILDEIDYVNASKRGAKHFL